MANSVNIPISLSLQSEDIVKEYKQAMQKMSNVSDLKNQFTEMLKIQAQYIANAEKIKDPLSKALNLQSAKEYSRLLSDIQKQVKKIDQDRLPEFEIPEIKFDNKQITNTFKGIDSEIKAIIDNIGTMNTMLGKSNISEIFKGVGETQVTDYYKNIVQLRKDIIKEEIKSGKVSSQSIENLLSVLQEAEVYQNRILTKNGKISDITKLLPKSIIDNEAFSKIMNREALEIRWKEITMPGFVDNVRNAIMTKITQIATGEDFKLPTIGLEMNIDVANNFGEYQKKIDTATEKLKKLVTKFYQTNEFRTDFQNLGISDDKLKTLNYYKLIFDIKSTMEEIETLSGAIGKSTKNIYGKKGLSGLVLNDYYSPDGDEYLGFNSIYEDLNSAENSKYLQMFKEKLISNILNGYKNVMTTVENETQDSLTKQLESINKILYTASDASYINNTSVEDEINSIIKSDDQAYTKLLNKRNEIISKLTDQGYEIESAVTDGIHGLVESNEIKKGKKVEFGRRKNDNNNNNINNVGSGSDSNATTNDKSVEEIDRRISDLEQEIQNIKQRIETISGEDKSNNNRVVDALQAQINELKNTVKNISGGGTSTKEIEDSLKKMQNDILEITEKIIGQETLGELRQNLDAVTTQINGLAKTNQITQLQSQLDKVNQIVTLLDDNLKSINSRLNQMSLNMSNNQNASGSNPTANSEPVNQEADAYERLNQIYAKYNELQNTHYEKEQFELRKKRLAQLKEYRAQLHELAQQIGEDDDRIKNLTIKDGDKSLSLFSDEMVRNNIDERISELGRKQQEVINKHINEFNRVKNNLSTIAPNGIVSESNLAAFEATVEYLKQLLETISNSEIFGDTISFQSDITELMNKAQNMTLPKKKKAQATPQRKTKQNNSPATSESKMTNNTRGNTSSEEDNAIISRLQSRIAALETKLNTLDRAKRDTKSRLTALEQTTGTTDASTKILAKKSELDTITNEIKEIRETINSLQTQIGNIIGRGVSSVDSNLIDSVNKNNDIFRQEVDAITKSLGALSKALADYDAVNHNIELPKINGDIVQIDTIIPKINELTKSLKDFKTAITGVADPSMMSNLDGLIGKLSSLSDNGKIGIQVENVKSVNDEIDKFSKMVIEWAEAIQIQKKAKANEVERVALYNSKNGFLSNSYVSDKNDEVRDAVNREMIKRYQKEKVDTHIHSHPENIAAFSFDDLNNHIKRLEYGITKNLVVASKEVMKIDLSGITDKKEYTKFIVNLQENVNKQLHEYMYNQLKNTSVEKIFSNSFMFKGSKSIAEDAAIDNKININQSILEFIDNKINDYISEYRKNPNKSNLKISNFYDGLMTEFDKAINQNIANNPIDKSKINQLRNEVSNSIVRMMRSASGLISEDEYSNARKNSLLDGFKNSKYSNVLSVMSIEDFKKNNSALSQLTQGQNNQSSDNTKLDEIIQELKNISQKMDASITKANNNASPNISANHSPNNVSSGAIASTISAEVQAASEASTAEVEAFKTIDDAVTGLTGDINTKTEAIRAEQQTMASAAESEVASISQIKTAVAELTTQIQNVPEVKIVGENDGKLNISVNLTEEQITVIREKLKTALSGEQAVPISFVPNVESLKQQIAEALKNVPVEITNNNINKVIKVNKFKANSDGVEALRNSISSQLKNVKIQSFDATTAAESVKETLSKVLDGIGLKFDTEKLGNEVQEAVSAGVEAANAGQKPDTSENKAIRFKEKATSDIGKLRDKYTDKLQGQQLEVFKERLNEIDNKIKGIKDDASNYTDENAQVIEKDIKQIETLVNSFKEINNSEDKINSLIQKLKDSKNNIERRGAVAQPVVNNINSEMSALEELKRSGQNLNVGNPAEVEAFIDKLHEADATVESLQQSAKDIRVSTNATASVAKLDSKFNDLLFKVDKFKRDNSKITSDKGISAQFDSLMRSIQTIEKTDVNFQRLRAQFDQLKATVTSKGLTGRSLGDELKYIAEKIGIKALLGNSIYRVIGAFRQMVGIVTELDTGMTTLRRVTDEVSKTYQQFLTTAGEQAHELGSTVSGLVDSTGDFARLGYNIQEANALAKNAVMYSNVGWLDISTATADITSTLKAFNIEASDSIRIVDTFDILGKKLPLVTISVKGRRHSRPSKDIVNHNICVTTAGGVW